MFRYTFALTNQGQGWSETLFRANAFGAGEEALLTQYINRRLELMATTTTMVSVRASNLDSKRDVTITELPSGGRGGTWLILGGSGGDEPVRTFSEDTFTALGLRLTDGAQNYRSFAMLGIPDHIFAGNQIVPTEEALLRSRLNNWMSAITQAGFGMKLQGVPGGSGRILTFEEKTVDNQLVCLGITGAPPAVGSHVMLGGVKPFNKLNRTWRVAQVIPAAGADPAFIYLAGSAGLNTFGPVQGGTWKTPTYGLAVLNAFTISRLTSRKTGVPFGTVRGRR